MFKEDQDKIIFNTPHMPPVATARIRTLIPSEAAHISHKKAPKATTAGQRRSSVCSLRYKPQIEY